MSNFKIEEGQLSEKTLINLITLLDERYQSTVEELNKMRRLHTEYLRVKPVPRWYMKLWFWIRYRKESCDE